MNLANVLGLLVSHVFSLCSIIVQVKQYEDWKRRQLALDDGTDSLNQSPVGGV